MRSRDGSFVDKMATKGSLLNLNGLIKCNFLEYVYKDVEYDNYVCFLCHQEYANIEDSGRCVLKFKYGFNWVTKGQIYIATSC